MNFRRRKALKTKRGKEEKWSNKGKRPKVWGYICPDLKAGERTEVERSILALAGAGKKKMDRKKKREC